MKWKKAIRVALIFIALMWIMHIIQALMGVTFIGLGIYPRDVHGIIGIFTAPLIHGGFMHLFSNTIPIFILIVIMYLAYQKSATDALVLIYIFTGIGMWLFARSSYHIGASGVVYGLVSFLFWTGLFRKNLRSIALSLAILFLYSGYIMGIFPGKPGISWDGHLIGALAGILVAYLLRNRIEKREELEEEEEYEEADPAQYYFDRDIFGDKE